VDAVADRGLRPVPERLGARWGWFLAAGIAWLVVALLVLRFTSASVTTVGVLMGAVFLVAGLDEFFVAYGRSSWAWAHVLLGVIFVLAAIYAFASPTDAFWSLAAVFGLLLVLIGALDIMQSTMSRGMSPVWGLGIATGVVEIILGFWASQQAFPVRGALLLVWIGVFAIFRGIADLVLAFELRARHE
jgi:uncharacterized membrane protein HdeD (DUF308 family)